ncbi:calmodulin-binding transcription activator 2 isoform X2 [Hemicordylus capensis]|uniref:calmodulin-binding transcription activator 2 isoform X2 n=1 Tax=Hemicordylus capensis TaxID=884348 RepID=UPI002303273A|nr:calmodulin-binding transcription activator 2 isoform X2 [Hemicordylus capensis]
MLSPCKALKMNRETTEVSENSHHLKVFLPKKLVDCVPKCPALPKERLRWNTNEEIASYLITFEKHDEWLSCSPKTRPQNGSIILYNRKKVKYRKDGYCWKKRKDGKTTREDHMKLKVKGVECLYGCYVHSSIVPTFHRRCYWLLQNPDIVLVHYLNVPAIEDCGKICGPVLCSINSDRKEWLKWSKDELVGQLKPMFHGIKWTCSNGNSTAEFSIEQLVQQILESHQAKPPPRTHACLCSSGLGSPGHVPHKCSSTKHRIISPKVEVRPSPYPALTEVQNISSGPEAKAESEPAKSSGSEHKDPKLARAPSPGVLEASPDSTQPSPGLAQPNGFPKQELPAVTLSVGLPGSTILVMTGLGSPEKPLALTPSQHLVSGEAGGPPAAPLGLALLPGAGLVLSQNLESTMETSEAGPAAFDPDCFLNSPKQGQTYGGGAGLQAKPEPPEPAALPAYSLYVPGNRFFIQDDGAGQAPLPPSPPIAAGTEVKSSPETPMETAGGEGSPPAEGPPGEGGGQAGEAAEIAATELQEELYSMIQTAAAAAAGGSFGLSFDSHFPDLISELMTGEGGPGGTPGSQEGSPSSESPVLVLPEALAEPCYAAGGGPEASPQPLVSITDFSPEWSYPEGGVKVLITGPWTEATEPYSCLFDQISVPASLIQSGVLRCYCPAHEAGLVPLQVACDSRLVSVSVRFEYRARNFMALPSTQLDWLSLDDDQFRMSILERLEHMEKRVAEMTAAATAPQQRGEKPPGQAASDSFEDRIVALCEKMMSRSCWLRSETLVHHVSFRGMTLLHLAAAQGYTRLIETLIKWRRLNAHSLDLEQEVDPLNVDHFSCTPLMWACALGHLEAAQLLYRWNSHALAIPDSLGRLPLTVARSRGHVKLATCLEELQRQEEAPSEQPEAEPAAEGPGSASKACGGLWRPTEALSIPSPLSASPDTGLSTASDISSPSELSEGSVSATSAYSSGSALRESPAYSPDAEGAMDVCQAPVPERLPGWYGREAPSPHGLPPAPFFMDCDQVGAAGHTEGPEPDLEPELLGYGENGENEEFLPATDVLQVDMITLAKQIIEATPEHIKQEDFSPAGTPLRERPGSRGLSETMSWLSSYLEHVDPLPNSSSSSSSSSSQRRSLASPSPAGAPQARLSPLPSPLGELSLERLPPPPTAASWAEFLNASAKGKMESDFALLTLSDHEQRELYEAAKTIQTAFRKYKGRRLKEQQEMAAAVIQRCYRKYKQYALYKKMTQAAILIQSKFRSYYEQKKFQQSRRAAVLIQQYYRSYKEYEKLKQGHRASAAMQQKIKGTFLTKKQDQAARKIMRFLRRCRHRMKELKQRQELEATQKRGLAT